MVSDPHVPFRGEIWWVTVDRRDDTGGAAEAAARRPVLVVQNDVGNAHARTVIAAAVSGVVTRKRYPQLVPLDPALLGRPATLRCDVIQTIEKNRMTERAAVVPRTVMDEVDAALRRSLALK